MEELKELRNGAWLGGGTKENGRRFFSVLHVTDPLQESLVSLLTMLSKAVTNVFSPLLHQLLVPKQIALILKSPLGPPDQTLTFGSMLRNTGMQQQCKQDKTAPENRELGILFSTSLTALIQFVSLLLTPCTTYSLAP